MLSNLVWAIRMECPLTIDRPFTMTHREDFRLANRQLPWSTPGFWFGGYHGVDQSHFNDRATSHPGNPAPKRTFFRKDEDSNDMGKAVASTSLGAGNCPYTSAAIESVAGEASRPP